LLPDLRLALRTFIQKPGFALIAVLTMALGIGATTAIFSVADAILWKSLPMPDPGRLVMVLERRVEEHGGWIPVSPGNFVDWKQSNRSFQHLAAYQYSTANLAGGDGLEPLRMETCLTGEDFFPALGATLELGRFFTPAENQMGADREVILSHKFWVRRFAADRGIVGKNVQIDGRSVSVVGVMPAGFDFPPAMDAWMPLALPPPVWRLRPAPILFSVARLSPGVPVEQARTEMDAIAHRLERQFPKTNTGWRTMVMPLREFLMGGLLSQYTWLLLGVTGFVLLIACANVANLQLARASGRVREMSIRTALGATRSRLVLQLLTESLVLSFAGAAIGVMFALWGVDLFRWGISAGFVQDIPNWDRISVDARALAFTVAVALASGVLAGLAPAGAQRPGCGRCRACLGAAGGCGPHDQRLGALGESRTEPASRHAPHPAHEPARTEIRRCPQGAAVPRSAPGSRKVAARRGFCGDGQFHPPQRHQQRDSCIHHCGPFTTRARCGHALSISVSQSGIFPHPANRIARRP